MSFLWSIATGFNAGVGVNTVDGVAVTEAATIAVEKGVGDGKATTGNSGDSKVL